MHRRGFFIWTFPHQMSLYVFAWGWLLWHHRLCVCVCVCSMPIYGLLQNCHQLQRLDLEECVQVSFCVYLPLALFCYLFSDLFLSTSLCRHSYQSKHCNDMFELELHFQLCSEICSHGYCKLLLPVCVLLKWRRKFSLWIFTKKGHYTWFNKTWTNYLFKL